MAETDPIGQSTGEIFSNTPDSNVSEPSLTTRKLFSDEAIDFNRRVRKPKFGTTKDVPMSIIQFEMDTGEQLSPKEIEIVKILEDQFYKISTYLGLNKRKYNIAYYIEKREDTLAGQHGVKRDRNGKVQAISISINVKVIKRIASSLESDPSSAADIIEMIKTLAHELFHSRQAIFDSDFYRQEVKNYVSSSVNMEAYLKQEIEVQARKFANDYFKHLWSNPQRNKLLDNSIMAYALRHGL